MVRSHCPLCVANNYTVCIIIIVVAMYCLKVLVDKLKPKGASSPSKRLNSIICFAQVGFKLLHFVLN